MKWIAAVFNFKPKIKEYISKHGNLVLIIGLLTFLIAYQVIENFISYSTAIFGFPLISFAYGIIVVAAISPTCVLYRYKSRFTFIVATLSYSIYLTHKQLYYLSKILIEKLEIEITEIWTFWICIAIAIIGGFILHLIIEKPFLKLRNRILIQQIKKQRDKRNCNVNP